MSWREWCRIEDERLGRMSGSKMALRALRDQCRRNGVSMSLKGMSGITTSKAEANSAYEATKQVRATTEATLKSNPAVVTASMWSAFSGIDKWFWPNYEQFIKSSDFSYGDWKEAALTAADQYRAVAAQVIAAASKSSAIVTEKTAAAADKDEKKPNEPEDNTMLIVGGVVVALLIGYALLPKGDAAR